MVERVAAEVVVVGGGPAGIAAAAHAAEAGRGVLVLDASPSPGGQVWRHHAQPPAPARPWLERLARSGAQVLSGAAVVDVTGPRTLLVARGEAALLVEHSALVVATGARELLLPFPGWTLPGVIGAGAAQALRESGARFEGLRLVVAGTGPLLLATAAALRRAGARVVGIAEQAPAARLARFAAALALQPGKLVEALAHGARLRGVPLRTGSWVREAAGEERVGRAVLTDGRNEWTWECDVLACGYGLVPNLELPRLLGCETTPDLVRTDDAQRTSRADVFAAGEACGIGGLGQALATGAVAGLGAAGASVPPALLRACRREQAFASRLALAFSPRGELRSLARPDTIVCRCEDATLAQVLSSRELLPGRSPALHDAPGAGSALRCAKLHTRAGMGPCQGRVCGAALGFLFGWTADTIRPPLLPVPLALLAQAGGPGPRGPVPQEVER